MKEFYREALQDKNGDPYIIIFSGENENYIEGYLYRLLKQGREFVFGDEVGLCLLERKQSDTYETLYLIDDEYQGKRLGSKLIDISKNLSKKLKARFVRLTKLERKIEHPMLKGFFYDANLSLYLKHGFTLCDIKQPKDMICDLFEEATLTQTELARKRLMYMDSVYSKIT